MGVNYAEQYILVKGYIDAKDERQRTMYGTFMAVVSRRDTLYLGVMFGVDEIAKEADFDELYAQLQNRDSVTEDATFSHNEAELHKFLDVSRTLNAVARNRNAKQAEQAISRFCTETLHLKAVTFVILADASETHLARFTQEKKEQAEPTQAENGRAPETEADDTEKKREPRNFILRCEPVLDPVKGVAMSDLSVGGYVCAKLPSDSVFYKLFARNFQGFDGVINAMVSGILVNEHGTAIVSLQLADDVAGIMKMSAKVKVRTASSPKLNQDGRKRFSLQTAPAEVVFGTAALIILLCSIGLIFYLMT